MFCPFLFLCPSSRHCLSWGSLTLCKLVLILPPPSKGLVQVCSRFLLPPASPCSHLASALPILLQRPENPALLLLEDLSGSGASSAAFLACSAFGLPTAPTSMFPSLRSFLVFLSSGLHRLCTLLSPSTHSGMSSCSWSSLLQVSTAYRSAGNRTSLSNH